MPLDVIASKCSAPPASAFVVEYPGGGDPLDEVAQAHARYLTPAHLRKGKGGRQPAADPRRDPTVAPAKARRILANRLSAARSKMKAKSKAEVWHSCLFVGSTA